MPPLGILKLVKRGLLPRGSRPVANHLTSRELAQSPLSPHTGGPTLRFCSVFLASLNRGSPRSRPRPTTTRVKLLPHPPASPPDGGPVRVVISSQRSRRRWANGWGSSGPWRAGKTRGPDSRQAPETRCWKPFGEGCCSGLIAKRPAANTPNYGGSLPGAGKVGPRWRNRHSRESLPFTTGQKRGVLPPHQSSMAGRELGHTWG